MNSKRVEHFLAPSTGFVVSSGTCGAARRRRLASRTHVESRAWQGLQKQEAGNNKPLTQPASSARVRPPRPV